MNTTKILAFCFSAFVLPLAQGMERNSFLDYHVGTHADLMRQVSTNARVMRRYTNHFKVSPASLRAAFIPLRYKRLASPHVYTVYSVTPAGLERVHTERVKAGTPVWVDQVGQPVLKVSCGNPLVKLLRVSAKLGLMRNPNRLFANAVPTIRIDEIPPISNFEALTLKPEVPVEPAPLIMIPGAAGSMHEVVSVTSRGSVNLSWLAAALLLLAIPTSGHHGTEAVPEPTTNVALALGALLGIRRKTRSKA